MPPACQPCKERKKRLTALKKLEGDGLRERRGVEVGAGRVDVDAVENVLGARGEAEADTGGQELRERVEAQHVPALGEDLGLELKVRGDELLGKVVWG